jgi:hypothetical protein
MIRTTRRNNWGRREYGRVGDSRGEAHVLRSLGHLALRCDDLNGAKKQLEEARDIFVRIGESFAEGDVPLDVEKREAGVAD